MRKFVLILLATLVSGSALAAGGYANLMDAKVDVSDEASLQRGAQLFANNCMGCHAAKFVRWNALPEELGVSMELIEENLIWDSSYEAGDVMNAAMRPEDGSSWFGAAPPDLSLTARSRGADWVYTYLNSFYVDPDASIGWNNTLLQNASMPHVLWQLQGVPEPVYEEQSGTMKVADIRLPEAQQGSMTPAEYEQATRDITNFMAFMAEPVRAKRQELGVWVIGFLLIFTILAYFMKREYWRDVH